MLKNLLITAALVIVTLSAGCGGGGGGGEPTSGDSFSFTVRAEGGAIGQKLYSVHFKVALPQGVTLRQLPDGSPGEESIALSAAVSGAHALWDANYVTTSVPTTVIFSLANSDGFPVGEIITITGSAAGVDAGAPLQASLVEFKAYDLQGAELPLVTGTVSPR